MRFGKGIMIKNHKNNGEEKVFKAHFLTISILFASLMLIKYTIKT